MSLNSTVAGAASSRRAAPPGATRAWLVQMRISLGQISAAVHHATHRGRMRAGKACERVLQRLREPRSDMPVREPQLILADWEAVDKEADKSAPVHEAVTRALRAEYAASLLLTARPAARLAHGPGIESDVFVDPRAAQLADELVAALWRDAAAAARAALYAPNSRECRDAIIELEELRPLIGDLELAVHERPWTEEA